MTKEAYADNDQEGETRERALSVHSGGSHQSSIRRQEEQQRGGVLAFLLSVRFLLPFTVALIVFIVALVTILLLVDNTDKAVSDVVEDLQAQVLARVDNRLETQLDRVLSVNLASARELGRIGLVTPTSNSTFILPDANQARLVTLLDEKINDFSEIDVHYIFYTNGRVIGILRNDATSNLYAEELPGTGLGLQIWAYGKENISSIPAIQTSAPIVADPSYVGYERAYFNNMDWNVRLDYAWTNPYFVATFLLFTNTITIQDAAGNFIGVMGADSYLTTLNAFMATVKPTQNSKVFVVDPNEEMVLSTSGGSTVVDSSNNRIKVYNCPDTDIAAAGRAVGAGKWVNFQGTLRDSFKEGGKTWLLAVQSFNKLRVRVTIAVATPEDDVLKEANDRTDATIGICSAIAVSGLAIIIILCVLISNNLNKLDKRLNKLSKLEIDDDTHSMASDSASVNGGQVEGGGGMFSELQRTNLAYMKLRGALTAFHHYVPAGVVHGVLHGDIEPTPGMRGTELAVIFQDIVGFTTLCEELPTDVVVSVVSKTFDQMTRIITENHGTIDKYIGDAIMAFWDVGRGGVQSAEDAARFSFISIRRSFETQHVAQGKHIRLRSGLHYGDTLIGNFGSRSRFNYTIVGDTVNTAARLEPLNKETKTLALVSGEIVKRLNDDALLAGCRPMGKVRLVGKQTSLPIYEVLAEELPKDARSYWDNTVECFNTGDYMKAKENLLTYQTTNSNATDAAADELMNEIAFYLDNPEEGSSGGGVRQQRAK